MTTKDKFNQLILDWEKSKSDEESAEKKLAKEILAPFRKNTQKIKAELEKAFVDYFRDSKFLSKMDFVLSFSVYTWKEKNGPKIEHIYLKESDNTANEIYKILKKELPITEWSGWSGNLDLGPCTLHYDDHGVELRNFKTLEECFDFCQSWDIKPCINELERRLKTKIEEFENKEVEITVFDRELEAFRDPKDEVSLEGLEFSEGVLSLLKDGDSIEAAKLYKEESGHSRNDSWEIIKVLETKLRKENNLRIIREYK